MKILLYSFYNRWSISCRSVYDFCYSKNHLSNNQNLNNVNGKRENNIMNKIPDFDVEIIKFYYGKFSSLKRLLLDSSFDYILGVGNGRKNARFHKVELCFINKYGSKAIIPKYPITQVWNSTWEIKISDELLDSVVYSNSITTGPCNRSVVNILEIIRLNQLKGKVGFIHLRKDELSNIKVIIESIIFDNIA